MSYCPTTPARNGRAHTSPWISAESLQYSNVAPRPILKKRHSAYALSVLQSTVPPVPDFPHPPIRPPRHPSRLNSTDSTQQQRDRRSVTAGSSESVNPWEDSSRESLDDAPSVKSQDSSLALSTHTGPVEEVTPWELYPVPSSKSFKGFTETTLSHLKSNKAFSMPHIPHKSTSLSTGPVEEVTPWELLPGPSQDNDNKPASPISPRTLSGSEHISVPVYPRSTATGPTEDVTPWELTPAPAEDQELEIPPHVTSSRTTLTMAQLEQVTPWELYPAPRSNGSKRSGQSRMPTGTRPSSSSNSSKMSNVAHRPRKRIINIPQLPLESTALPQQKGISSNAASTSKVNGSTSIPLTPGSSQDRQDLKFSTADRTILEQLKMSIRAKEAQFVVKGIGNSVVGGGKSAGKKHHPYSAKEVPYPRSYEREVVDLDVWETMFCLDICENLTWHVFETPPTKVLEIGCGTGTWIIHSAQHWKACHFVGLDIVPLHPDLQNVGSPDLASRITWVQHNFLDGLPFQNEEFDFVHIKRIALGVPEDKWDKVFEEIARVMKPDAAFEMVEEDLFFPGKHVSDHEDSIKMDNSLFSFTDWNSTSSDRSHASVNGFPIHDDVDSPETPTTSTTHLPRTHSTSNSPIHGPRSAIKENEKEVVVNGERVSHDLFPSPPLRALNVPITISPTTPTTPITTPMSPMPFPTASKEPHPITGTNIAGFGASTISLFSAIGTVNDALMSRARSSSVHTSTTGESKTGSSSFNLLSDSESKQTTKPSPCLLKMLTQAPTNPRDHTLLETIWSEMLGSRWVNLSPLSLLTTYLEFHFKDVRTHPPFLYTFPLAAPKPQPADDDSDSDSDVGGTPNTANLPLNQPPCLKAGKSSNPGAAHGDDKRKFREGQLCISTQLLQQQFSPHVMLDGTRGNAYSPSQQTISKAREGKTLAAKRMSRLPTTPNIDSRTLNLHLALRAKEILACSESMWEWVVEFQKASEKSASSLNAPSSWSLDVTRCAILEMTRDDFDQLLNNFTFDFQDQAAVGYALQERFNWHVFPSRRLQDRKAFDKACKKYQKWVLAERTRSPLRPDHKSNGIITDTRNSLSTPNINSSIRSSATPIARSHSSPQATDGTALAHDSPRPSDPAIDSSYLSSPHLTTPSAPTQRLSRSMRVFVAWKASS